MWIKLYIKYEKIYTQQYISVHIMGLTARITSKRFSILNALIGYQTSQLELMKYKEGMSKTSGIFWFSLCFYKDFSKRWSQNQNAEGK